MHCHCVACFFVFNHCHGVFSWLESLTWCSLSIQIPTLVKFIDLKHRRSEVYQFESLSLWSLSIWHLVLVKFIWDLVLMKFIDSNPCLGEVCWFESLSWWSLLIWILVLVKYIDSNQCKVVGSHLNHCRGVVFFAFESLELTCRFFDLNQSEVVNCRFESARGLWTTAPKFRQGFYAWVVDITLVTTRLTV